MDERVYFRQLKAGRDFGVDNPVAGSMANFIYLIGDRLEGECLVVDPAWDVDGVVDVAHNDGMKITGALVTHWHPDHVGGDLMGHDVQGLARLLAVNPCPIHVNKHEVEWVRRMTGLGATDLVAHESGDIVTAGEVEVECLHTPGHTAGSQCFRCKKALISGDTLFLQGCGRLDLPTADVDEMWRTLNERLSTVSADTVLYPGHDYGAQPHAPMEHVRQTNGHLKVPDLDTWRRMMGR